MALRFPLKELWHPGWLVKSVWRAARVYANHYLKILFLMLAGAFPLARKKTLYRFLYSYWLGLWPIREPKQKDDDALFARERLDGPNPVLIERVQSLQQLQALMPVTDAQLSTAMEAPLSLQAEIAAGHLFVCDYRLLAKSLLPAEQPWAPPPGKLGRDSRYREKYLPAPVALFCHRAGGKEGGWNLLPVAILIDQPDATSPNPLYVRRDEKPYVWNLAKLYVRIADANLHEQAVHNFRHHFVAGAVAATTRRKLAREHPLYVLFEPHLANTLFVNRFIFKLLNHDNGDDDKQFSGDLEEDRQILIEAHASTTWRGLSLKADLQRRGMEGYPDYPWREDALSWRAALRDFAADYLGLFYKSDAEVAGDRELAAWLAELESPDGGGLKEVGPLGTVEQLIELVTDFLFLVGPSHASVHYPLLEYATRVEAFPRAAYRPPPYPEEIHDLGKAARETPEQKKLRQRLTGIRDLVIDRIETTLPPIRRGAIQFRVGWLAGFRYTRFGGYRWYRLAKVAEAQPAILRLKERLAQITREIEERNQRRARPYRYLLPRNVPNSVNL